MKIALFRNEFEVSVRFHVPKGTRQWEVPYINSQSWKTYEPEDLVECWKEVFTYSGITCPCCGNAIFNSQNYMTAPQWMSPIFKAQAESTGSFNRRDQML